MTNEFLDRYLAGEASDLECQHVARWLQDPKNAAVATMLRAVPPGPYYVPRVDESNGGFDIEPVVDRLMERGPEAASRRPHQTPPRLTRSTAKASGLKRYGGWLGGIGIAAAGVALAFLAPQHRANPEPAWSSKEYQASSGQMATAILPGGTQMTLAPGTQIRSSYDPQGGTRVELTGQAFFTVASSHTLPFTVVTPRAEVRVLGTAFDVAQYPDDESTRIVVRDGKVSVQGDSVLADEPLVLTAGRAATLRDSSVIVETLPDTMAIGTWQDGRLAFRDAPVPILLSTLERWMGYQFQLADSVLASRYVTTVLDVRNRADVLQALQDLLDVSITIKNHVVTLRPAARQSHQKRVEPKPRSVIVASRTEVSQ